MWLLTPRFTFSTCCPHASSWSSTHLASFLISRISIIILAAPAVSLHLKSTVVALSALFFPFCLVFPFQPGIFPAATIFRFRKICSVPTKILSFPDKYIFLPASEKILLKPESSMELFRGKRLFFRLQYFYRCQKVLFSPLRRKIWQGNCQQGFFPNAKKYISAATQNSTKEAHKPEKQNTRKQASKKEKQQANSKHKMGHKQARTHARKHAGKHASKQASKQSKKQAKASQGKQKLAKTSRNKQKQAQVTTNQPTNQTTK